MSKNQNGKTATPEFIHFARKYNRDIPVATHENFEVLLKFYKFAIATFTHKTQWNIERHAICLIDDREHYLGNTHTPSCFVQKPSLFFSYPEIKLHLQSLCNRHELPIKTVDFLRLIDLSQFVAEACHE